MYKKVVTLNNNKSFINLCFLQKMNCQKTEGDQARISSLVLRFGAEPGAGVGTLESFLVCYKYTVRESVQ